MSNVYEINCTTGEKTIRPLTSTEMAQIEAERQEAADRAKADASAKQALDAQKKSALDKLRDLGLTDEEVAALLPPA